MGGGQRAARPSGGGGGWGVDAGFLALLGGDGCRGTGERVEARTGLRERDDIPERVRTGEQHADAVPAESDAAVRRRAVEERVEQAAALLPRRLRADSHHREDPLLHVTAMDTDGPTAELVAVA